MSKRKDTVLAAAGLLLPAFVASRLGWQAVVKELAAVREGVALIVALSLVRLILQTRSWSLTLRLDRFHGSTCQLMLVPLPARIGADESGAAGAFLSFGLPAAAGIALALARRTRDLLACLVGLTWLVCVSRRGANPATSEADPTFQKGEAFSW